MKLVLLLRDREVNCVHPVATLIKAASVSAQQHYVVQACERVSRGVFERKTVPRDEVLGGRCSVVRDARSHHR